MRIASIIVPAALVSTLAAEYNDGMKKRTVVLLTVVAVLVVLTSGIVSGVLAGKGVFSKPDPGASDGGGDAPTVSSERPFGVWWWDNRLDASYLNFALEQGVNEIYLYASAFSDRTSAFLSKAAAHDVKVFWLAGKYEWIDDPTSLYGKMAEYRAFQQAAEYKFAGVHFDIEPHQHPDFDTERERLISAFVTLTANLHRDFPEEFIEYDIPFWLDDEIEMNGERKPAYAFVIDNASRVTVMSYRDSADKIYDCAKEEVLYAESIGKTLNLGVETGENEDIVTFFEEGAEYMYAQLDALRQMIPSGFGTVVHHIKSWRSLRP